MMSIRQLVECFAAAGFNRRIVVSQLSKPVVSFTFDDFPRSALLCAGELLTEYGVRGTYYASLNLMGKTTEVGRMFTADDLRKAVESRHELGCHTHDHVACRTISCSEALANCERNRRAIDEVLPGYRVRNFAFPFGSVGLHAKSALSSVYTTCRGIYPGLNRGRIDLALLRSFSLESGECIKKAIDLNTRKNGWLILYTHDVCARPSPYGCTPGTLRDVLRCAMASGADILPVADVVAKLAPVRMNS
jgi:peptidoglycan/xylan/chitin deacetylase (PgdA/CDA1 family)